MNKIIGGLLVLSILSRPSILRMDYVAYEVYKSNERIINYLIKEQSEKTETKTADIDMITDDIDMNRRYIQALLLQKDEVIDRIETKLDFNAFAKVSLTPSQIDSFQEFNEFYVLENMQLTQAFSELDDNSLNEVQKQLLHTDTDLDNVYEGFTSFNDKQNEVIYTLENIVAKGNELLEVI